VVDNPLIAGEEAMSSDQAVATTIAGFPALKSTVNSAKPPIVFIHGAFVTHLTWAGWMEEFAKQGWSSIAASTRGRLGVGPARAQGLTIKDYLADTLKVIDTLDQLPIVIGHSMGGLVAQKIAELGKCRAAVLLSSAPSGMLPAQPVALPALIPMFPKIIAGLPMLPAAGGCARLVLNRVPEENRAAIHGALVHESGKVYREMIFGTYKIDTEKVKCPIYVVGAEEDRVVSPQVCKQIADRYHAELRIYPGHAHWFLAEPGWEKIAGDTALWLDRNVLGSKAKLHAAA
jgi:pimeloyl-ACP methyl ester carboxylesterase